MKKLYFAEMKKNLVYSNGAKNFAWNLPEAITMVTIIMTTITMVTITIATITMVTITMATRSQGVAKAWNSYCPCG